MSRTQKEKNTVIQQQKTVAPAAQDQRRRIKKLHEVTTADDIRYRGPLSYQGFQALGWACIVASVLRLILAIGGSRDPRLYADTRTLMDVLTYLVPLPLPFLLIANFSRILNNSEGYKKQLLRNSLAAVEVADVVFTVELEIILVSVAGGVVNLTKALAGEWGKYNITVNSICPGYFYTPLTQETLDSDYFQQYAKTVIPMERYGVEGELDAAAVFLASAEASYVTGIALPVDGGYTSM